MKTFFALALAGFCCTVGAQTPVTNPMPDGSVDRYIGLGVVTAPAYPGGSERRVRVRPLLQFETSHGIFIAGMSAGIHLSDTPGREWGPLLALDPGRNAAGQRDGAGGVTDSVAGFGVRQESALAPTAKMATPILDGVGEVKARVQAGAFGNTYLSSELRLTSSLLYGAGNGRDGLLATIALQRMSAEIAPHHRITLALGATLVNARHNQAYFGVTDEQAGTSGLAPYAPRGGLRELYVSAGWNWALSPSWIVASGARLAVLQGDARHSPLVERPTSFTVSTGLAYRF